MGRDIKELDADKLFDLLEQGMPAKHIAKEMGVSAPTISKRIADLQRDQGLLLQYRSIQALHLTSLQSQILEAISPDKIAEAPLKDLVLCYKVLKDKELITEGKPSEIKGLVSYLVHMEREQLACEEAVITQQGSPLLSSEFNDVDFEEERMPNL